MELSCENRCSNTYDCTISVKKIDIDTAIIFLMGKPIGILLHYNKT